MKKIIYRTGFALCTSLMLSIGSFLTATPAFAGICTKVECNAPTSCHSQNYDDQTFEAVGEPIGPFAGSESSTCPPAPGSGNSNPTNPTNPTNPSNPNDPNNPNNPGSGNGSGSGSGNPAGTGIPLPPTAGCCEPCRIQIPYHHALIQSEIEAEFKKFNAWTVSNYWNDNLLKALALMAEQLTATGILQVQIFGQFLDAKHQLETQRLFQTLTAKAHKDYHPSEGMCTFGTSVRSLAASERRSDLAQTAFAQRMMQRQTLNGESIAVEGEDSDIRSRADIFVKTYCDQADNSNGLGNLCKTATPAARRNIDIDYMRNIESRLTLDVDFVPVAGPMGTTIETLTPDEQDVFALSANLFSHNVAYTPSAFGVAGSKKVRQDALEKYMELRSVFAKRSVAQNSFAAATAMRAAGDPESAPYTKAIIRELGVANQADIEKFLGKNPSYFAQMEVLTKKIYQNPTFYTELYDKPVNIERKGAALQAIGLMQDRDLYNSLLRSEAVLSVLLETMLVKEQDKIVNARGGLEAAGGSK